MLLVYVGSVKDLMSLNYEELKTMMQLMLRRRFLAFLFRPLQTFLCPRIPPKDGEIFHVSLFTSEGKQMGVRYSPSLKELFKVGVSNGPIQFETARKIWPLLELLAKIR